MFFIYFYFAFFLSMLLTSIIHFPVLIIRPFNPKNTEMFLQILNFFVKLLLPINFKSSGYNYSENHIPSIMISNHQSNFDILWASFVLRKKIVALGKWEILYFPIFGLNFLLSGNILIKRGDKKSRDLAMKKIKEKITTQDLSIVIFPEGHRNTRNELLPFKDGAFKLAKALNIPIVNFVIEPYSMKIGKKKDFDVFFYPPIPINEVLSLSVEELKHKCTLMIQTKKESY